MTPPPAPFLFLLYLFILHRSNTCVHPRMAERIQGEVHTTLHLWLGDNPAFAVLTGLSLRDRSTALPFPSSRQQLLQSQQLSRASIKPVGGCQPLRARSLRCRPWGKVASVALLDDKVLLCTSSHDSFAFFTLVLFPLLYISSKTGRTRYLS